ncbi:MAG: hypothetical protein QOF51_3450 [Chloroflexota bacterium]|nr:hypothetical protein [Chloroflexota bacterium]
MNGGKSNSQISLRLVVPGDVDLLAHVVALADRNKRTLGPMPRGAFPEFAHQGGLLAALDDRHGLAGYALFAVAKGRVRLIHLCVDDRFRRNGVAGQLVDFISRLHSDLTGIKLRCRSDYAAQALWPKLGFAAVNEVPGRGRSREPLVVWWRSHNRPDLFSDHEHEDAALMIALDHNVFIDLAIDRPREGAAESQGLEADWLQNQILNEILRLQDPSERSRQRAAESTFPRLQHTPEQHERASRVLRLALGGAAAAHESDFNHVVCAAAGGASLFVTRDEEWIALAAEATFTAVGVRTLRPSDVITHIDELEHAENYRPAALRGTGYSVQDTAALSETFLDPMLSTATGERRRQFRAHLRSIAGDRALTGHHVRSPEGEVVVAWATGQPVAGGELSVPLLRASRAPVAPTIVRLLLLRLRMEAIERGTDSVRVSDPHPGRVVLAALAEDGYVSDGTQNVAAVLDVRSTTAALARVPLAHPVRSELASAREGALSPQDSARLERLIWPAKLLDTTLESFLIPIQPRWARELLSLQDSLWDRSPVLGVSREHVYYRSPRGNPHCPARILWYASGTGRDRVGAVVACSQLNEIVTDDPRRLYSRFQHLGVYRLADIEARASGGEASALRFVDTEVLAHPVTYERLKILGGGKSPGGSLQSPTRISPVMFEAIYREGTRRDG